MVPTVGLLVQTTSGFGGEKVFATLLGEIAKAGRLRPIAITVDERWSSTAHELGVKQVCLERRGPGPLAFLQAARKLSRVIADDELAAVVSFMTYANLLGLAGVRASRTGCRAIVSEHTQTLSAIGSGRWPPLARAAVRALYPSADAILAVSGAVRAELVDGLGLADDLVRVVENPVDVDAILAGSNASWPPRADRRSRQLVSVGALNSAKGHSCALAALAALPATYRLDLIGDGPLRGALEDQVSRLGLGGRVRFHGFVANPYPLIAAADALVHPSEREGFGLAVVEAGVLGVPVVASAVGGLPALIPNPVPGVLVPVGDAGALAAGIVSLFQDRPADDGLTRARIRDRFGPASVGRRYEEAALGVPFGALA